MKTGYYPSEPGTKVRFGILRDINGDEGHILSARFKTGGRTRTIKIYPGIIDPACIKQEEELLKEGLEPFYPRPI
ncbi:hypothetical protein J4470_03965 [Candidatus Woesearchaeota archaeon]|nr:hypothetical protein [Candidatus Woesearchaeota archaeon]